MSFKLNRLNVYILINPTPPLIDKKVKSSNLVLCKSKFDDFKKELIFKPLNPK
mgnify:FL=1